MQITGKGIGRPLHGMAILQLPELQQQPASCRLLPLASDCPRLAALSLLMSKVHMLYQAV